MLITCIFLCFFEGGYESEDSIFSSFFFSNMNSTTRTIRTYSYELPFVHAMHQDIAWLRIFYELYAWEE